MENHILTLLNLEGLFCQPFGKFLIPQNGDTPRHMCINIFRKDSVGLFQKHFASIFLKYINLIY